MTDNIIPLPGARDSCDAGQGKRLRVPAADVYIFVHRNLPVRRGRPPVLEVGLHLPEISGPRDPQKALEIERDTDLLLCIALLQDLYSVYWPVWVRGRDTWGEHVFDEALVKLETHIETFKRIGVRYSIAVIDLDRLSGKVA